MRTGESLGAHRRISTGFMRWPFFINHFSKPLFIYAPSGQKFSISDINQSCSKAKLKLAFYNHFLEKIRIICQNQVKRTRKLLFGLPSNFFFPCPIYVKVSFLLFDCSLGFLLGRTTYEKVCRVRGSPKDPSTFRKQIRS